MAALAALLAVGSPALTGVLVGRALAALLSAARLACAALLAAVAARALLLIGLLVRMIRTIRMIWHVCRRWRMSSAQRSVGNARTALRSHGKELLAMPADNRTISGAIPHRFWQASDIC
jgi:hypothetical protein